MPNESVSLESAQMFEAVCKMLQAGHRKSESHSAVDTLNRLFRKNMGDENNSTTNLPTLGPDNVSVRLERWSKPKLRELAPRAESRSPARLDLPVVVIKYQGKYRLIDGGSRCHHWHIEGEIDDHEAFILTIEESTSA